MHSIERVDWLAGTTVEKLPRPFGLKAWAYSYYADYWWVAHNGVFTRKENQENRGNTLTKLNGAFQISGEIPLPAFSPRFFFSPDNAYVYFFCYKNHAIVLNAGTLAVINVLYDKSDLKPLGFDADGRFWLQRNNSTVEAWDAVLGNPLSRHKLKGAIMGDHMTEQGAICVVTLSEKEGVLRVYKLV